MTCNATRQVASRVENLYFTYLFTLRAVQKAAPLLQALQYSSGYVEEDDQTKQLVSKLVCHQ
jgi:Endoplasmic Reticulum Oxidoreductin 1 (ERO1)